MSDPKAPPVEGPKEEPPENAFNPVIVEVYREVGYLPDAILNYLMLLSWALDDKTEDFTREEMIRDFTLERVTKSPASFDLVIRAPLSTEATGEVEGRQDAAFLQQAGLVTDPPTCEVGPKLAQIVEGSDD